MHPPPGYPFEGPLKSRPPPSSAEKEGENDSPFGLAAFVVAFATLMAGSGFLLVALLVTESRRAPASTPEAPEMTTAGPEAAEGQDPSSRVVDSPETPTPPTPRNVPYYPVRFLEGCSAQDLATLEDALSSSIARGAPLYNEGDVAGCAADYEHTAKELESTLPASCRDPMEALARGRASASKLSLPSSKAWAMRDAFDGLLEVIERSRTGGVGNL